MLRRAMLLNFLIGVSYAPAAYGADVGESLAAQHGCNPVDAAKTNPIQQRGYSFNAQSLPGADCIYYLLYNSPDGVAVHLEWYRPLNREKSFLIAHNRLPGCSDDSSKCDCTDTKPCYVGQRKHLPAESGPSLKDTTLQWGSQASSLDHVDPEVAVHVAEPTETTKAEITENISGFISSDDGEVRHIDISFWSSYYGEGDTNLIPFTTILMV